MATEEAIYEAECQDRATNFSGRGGGRGHHIPVAHVGASVRMRGLSDEDNKLISGCAEFDFLTQQGSDTHE